MYGKGLTPRPFRCVHRSFLFVCVVFDFFLNCLVCSCGPWCFVSVVCVVFDALPFLCYLWCCVLFICVVWFFFFFFVFVVCVSLMLCLVYMCGLIFSPFVVVVVVLFVCYFSCWYCELFFKWNIGFPQSSYLIYWNEWGISILLLCFLLHFPASNINVWHGNLFTTVACFIMASVQSDCSQYKSYCYYCSLHCISFVAKTTSWHWTLFKLSGFDRKCERCSVDLCRKNRWRIFVWRWRKRER